MFKSGSDADDRAQCLCQCHALKNSGELFIITDSFLPPDRLINYEESLTTAAATTKMHHQESIDTFPPVLLKVLGNNCL